jgi:Holliday junction resolvase RusA-like endonuclease
MPVVEFTVEGPPVSHQSRNKRALAAWKAQVQAEAAKVWAKAPMKGLLKCTILYFFEGPDAPLDDDNMVKPIRDAMNGVVYEDDSQIRHSEHAQTSIDGAFQVRGVSKVILDAFAAGKEFIYIRIEDAPPQLQLPK